MIIAAALAGLAGTAGKVRAAEEQGCATSAALASAPSRPPEELRRVILDFAGPAVSVAEAKAAGPVFAAYEARFSEFADRHWKKSGARWDEANYYDRAKIYYVWWARTGKPEYLARANALALDYRKNYIEANAYHVATWWSMLGGVTLHYLVTGDECSRLAVGKVADGAVAPYVRENNWANLVDPEAFDGRDQSRFLQAILYAALIDAPSLGVPNIQPNGEDWGVSGGNDWRALLPEILGRILTTQAPTGARRYKDACGHDKPFMNGLLNDALIEYDALFVDDPRILPFIKANLDYMWNHEWLEKDRAFKYLEVRCGDDPENGPVPAPDLNNLIVNGFGWIFSRTRDETYRQRGDAIFAGGSEQAYLVGGKMFNQNYASSYKYIAFRR